MLEYISRASNKWLLLLLLLFFAYIEYDTKIVYSVLTANRKCCTTAGLAKTYLHALVRRTNRYNIRCRPAANRNVLYSLALLFENRQPDEQRSNGRSNVAVVTSTENELHSVTTSDSSNGRGRPPSDGKTPIIGRTTAHTTG